MASTTTRRPKTTTPSTRTARGRARPSAKASRGTTAQAGLRGTAQRATTMARTRRKQEPTGLKGVIAKATDAIPGMKGSGKRSKSSSRNPISGIVDALPIGGGGKKSAKSSSSRSGKRAGGAALAAGAAGLAIKNRGKIASMLKREDDAAVTAGGTDTTAGTTADDASVSRLDVTPTDVTTPPSPGSAG